MGQQNNNNRAAVAISTDGNTAVVASEDVRELTIAVSGDYYSIYDANNDPAGYLYAASSNANQLKTETTLDDNGKWSITFENGVASIVASQSSNHNVMQYNSTNQLFACYASASQKQVYLYVKSDETPSTYSTYITGYGESAGGYRLIASPINNLNPAAIAGMTTGDYDLYSFDQSETEEWRNYKASAFNLEPGKGYLYAKKATTETSSYEFTLTGTPYSGNGEVALSYDASASFAGWNLVGNPWGTAATIETAEGTEVDFYVMNSNGTNLIPSDDNTVAAMQGIFVIAQNDDDVITFVQNETPAVEGKLVLNVTKDRSAVVDRAIVRFGQGNQLPKFMLNPDNTKLYIPQGNEDFAVVRSANEAELPVNFKAIENGTYTLSVNPANIEMEYMHLIDNMTGADIDLIVCEQLSLHTARLALPHPRLAERPFVLLPLARTAPHWRHPRTGQNPAQMLRALARR